MPADQITPWLDRGVAIGTAEANPHQQIRYLSKETNEHGSHAGR
jgi:hypothetical protein